MNTLLDKIELRQLSKINVLNSPKLPGVYIFYNNNRKVIYVGKSVSLKNRLSSYLGKNLGPKTTELVETIKYFSFIVVDSEIESLLLEAHLVKKFMPKYNSALKDDKTPLYIVIVKDKLNWVTVCRKSQLKNYKGAKIFGPFISGEKVNTVLKTLRRIFPYSMHKPSDKVCFYSHIGLCNPCPGIINLEKDIELKKLLIKKYNTNLLYLTKVLDGKKDLLINHFQKSMGLAIKSLNFEKAKEIKKIIDALEFITSYSQHPNSYYENPNLIDDIIDTQVVDLHKFLSAYININKLHRIECFDIAHISGNFPTASMVTFIDGIADKTLYRHFRIRQKRGYSDTDSIGEVARRRINYLEKWGVPDLIIVDGGKGQVSKFFDIFNPHEVAVVGIAKRNERIVFIKKLDNSKQYKMVPLKRGPALYLVQKLRDEAHRFARRYHHHLFKSDLLKTH